MTSEGKNSQKPPRKPAVKKAKGERQKAKGRSVTPGEVAAGDKSQAKVNPETKRPHIEILPTANSKLLTDAMEVHHHPQLDHNPKPIKEYLLEGFMIFIAVMMGFIAENVREYIDNNEHAQQLCTQLVQDLKADTADLNNVSIHTAVIARQNDTLFNMLQQPLAVIDARKMLELANDSHSMWPFHPTGGAIEAIKNELHLKQFSNSAIIAFIARYEGHSQLMHTAQDITLQYQRLYVDPFILQHFNPRDVDDALNRRPLHNVQAHNLNQADMTQMAGEMALVHVNTNEQVRDCAWLKKDATELLQYVQKHFDVQ